MKISSVGFALLGALAAAEDSVSPLTYTYQTLTGGTVKFTSTVYPLSGGGNSASTVASSTATVSAATTAAPSSATPVAFSDNCKTSQKPGGYGPGPHGYGSPKSQKPWGWGWGGGNPWASWAPWGGYGPGGHGPGGKTSSKQSGGSTSTPTKSAQPTRYTLNPADLAYPVYQNASPAVANAPAAPGLPNATVFASQAIELVLKFQNANSTNCQRCKDVFKGLQASMKVNQETLATIATPFCQAVPVIQFPICLGLFHTGSTDLGGIFPNLDLDGDEGSTLCAFTFGLCDLPPPPKIDTNALFKGKAQKPPAKDLTPSGKTPLKVLHFSDYHLDPRYVVGSEGDCGSSVCCRVFPYTDTNATIKQPASLFGNYNCDTPEALATSVFRSLPKVAGGVDSFSFAIFTGDIVSHDIWELTPSYTVANTLIAYQQWFDGLGDVKVYPTLGNHDTYPQAFTAWPYQNNILPTNASYPVQQQYNYENVSAAWQNYGWLTAEEAASVGGSGLGIYRSLTKEGLVIISMNSDLWYTNNFYSFINVNKVDPTGMFGQLVDYLLDAEAKNQPAWIIQHVPTGGTTDYEAFPAPSDVYYQIVDRFNNTIRGVFYGHTHRDEFSVFYSNNGTVKNANTAAAVAWIMPSVTTYTNLNGGFRYYEVDPVTFEVMDSINYYANVSNAAAWTQAGDVTWEFEYSARATYDPTGKFAGQALGPAFWHTAAENIANNATLFQTYTDLRSKLYRPYGPPSASNKQDTLCGLTSMSVPIFEDCLNSTRSTSTLLRRSLNEENEKPKCNHLH